MPRSAEKESGNNGKAVGHKLPTKRGLSELPTALSLLVAEKNWVVSRIFRLGNTLSELLAYRSCFDV